MSTHKAVAALKPRSPLALIDNPTVKPGPGQVRIRNEWTASTPLDLHQADGGLSVANWPHVLGDNVAGTVVEVGEGVTRLAVGDKVMGFVWRSNTERAYQTYVTTDGYLISKAPSSYTLQQLSTVPDNLVTTFHTLGTELGLDLPWPANSGPRPATADKPFLVWAGSSSVGQYAIQVLKYYGFTRIFTTASKRHHEYLKQLGASEVFDYSNEDVVRQILDAAGPEPIPYIFDCIGSFGGSMTPISQIAKPGSKYAVLLPVVEKDATTESAPEFHLDLSAGLKWAEGVEPIGVRTHFYLQNEMYKNKLQQEIIPHLLADGVVKPNNYKVVEGKSMLERAQQALDRLRNKETSGERLVWQVADE